MSLKQKENPPEESSSYVFWIPDGKRSLAVGAERLDFPLPALPLPLHGKDLKEGEPTDAAIGQGVYDYLRQFPECPDNRRYAELLRDAFPHFLADLGSQIVMLEHKEVDAPYLLRKLAYLKIFALLEPENGGLQQQLGMSCYELGMTYAEFRDSRRHLLAALGYLQRSLEQLPGNLTSLNLMGQIDFLIGDYPSAARRWGAVVASLEEGAARQALNARIARIDAREVPEHPLVDDLEEVGAAMELYGSGDLQGALATLEHLEEEGTLPREMPSAEFFYLLGVCRAKTGDAGGAFEALEKALELDPEHPPSLATKDDLLEGRIS